MSKQNRIKLLLDILTFAAFLIAMDPHTSGISIHEWLSIAIAATVIVHLLLNWDWIVRVSSRLFSKGLNGSRANYILNWLLFVDGILIMLSGIMISEAVVPSLGLTLPQNFTWRSLHDLSANISLVLMGLHLALHWNWIASTAKRLFTGGEVITKPMMERKDAQA
jgi:cytochrome b